MPAVDCRLEDVVRGAVAGLPPHLRQVVVLKHDAGLKFREIAVVLGIPLSTVLSRMRRAAELLRPALKEYAHHAGRRE